MNILHYSENVYHQFFRKIDEVDYFLQEAVNNQAKYAETQLPKDNKFFDTMQFVFSAFLGALVSSWEISRLSIQLENFISGRKKDYGLPSERSLTNDFYVFKDFFNTTDAEIHSWFCFLKVARNASAHDGLCAINGGNDQLFKYSTDIHRFEWYQSLKVFKHSCTTATQLSAVTSMLAMAYKLSPLFFSKLKCPEISPETNKEIARFNVDSTYGLNDLPFEHREQIISTLAQYRNPIPKRLINQKITEWEDMYKARFTY